MTMSYTLRSGSTAHQSADSPRDDLGKSTRYLRSNLGVLNRRITFRLCTALVGRYDILTYSKGGGA